LPIFERQQSTKAWNHRPAPTKTRKDKEVLGVRQQGQQDKGQHAAILTSFYTPYSTFIMLNEITATRQQQFKDTFLSPLKTTPDFSGMLPSETESTSL
jgi:hypothetical protein